VVSSCSYSNQLPDSPLFDDGLSHEQLFIEDIYNHQYRIEMILQCPFCVYISYHFFHPKHCPAVEVIFDSFLMNCEIGLSLECFGVMFVSVATVFWMFDVSEMSAFEVVEVSVVWAFGTVEFAEAIARILFEPGVMSYQIVTTHSVEVAVVHLVAVEVFVYCMMGYQIVTTRNRLLDIVAPY
jgi:hypothetical protein